MLRWKHDPLLENRYFDKSLAFILLMHDILPPKEWMHYLYKSYAHSMSIITELFNR